MKVINNYFNIQCGTCGTGMRGEQHWFEATHIIVHCQNPNCGEYEAKYKLPIQRIELEPYVEPEQEKFSRMEGLTIDPPLENPYYDNQSILPDMSR